MKAVFLTGSMGAGKSTILNKAEYLRQDGLFRVCKEYDILGVDQNGADSLSKYKKEDVMQAVASYSGKKLVIAGEYYSKQVDLKRFKDMGFTVYVILLNVKREEIYRRVLKRGSGMWNENTYKTNITNRVNFYKSHKGKKWIMNNSNELDQQQVIDRIISI